MARAWNSQSIDQVFKLVGEARVKSPFHPSEIGDVSSRNALKLDR